jgi:hypothetical protein
MTSRQPKPRRHRALWRWLTPFILCGALIALVMMSQRGDSQWTLLVAAARIRSIELTGRQPRWFVIGTRAQDMIATFHDADFTTEVSSSAVVVRSGLAPGLVIEVDRPVVDISLGNPQGASLASTRSAVGRGTVRVDGNSFNFNFDKVDVRMRNPFGTLTLWLRNVHIDARGRRSGVTADPSTWNADGEFTAGALKTPLFRASGLSGKFTLRNGTVTMENVIEISERVRLSGSLKVQIGQPSLRYEATVSPSQIDLRDLLRLTIGRMNLPPSFEDVGGAPENSDRLNAEFRLDKLEGALLGVQRVTGNGALVIPEMDLTDVGLARLAPVSRAITEASNLKTGPIRIDFGLDSGGVSFGPVRVSTELLAGCFGGHFDYPFSPNAFVWFLAKLPARFGSRLSISPDVVQLLKVPSGELILPLALREAGSTRLKLSLPPDALARSQSEPAGNWREELFFNKFADCRDRAHF